MTVPKTNPKTNPKPVKRLRPDFTIRHEAKVLCVLPLPRLIDTTRGVRVLYTRPDGWYSDQPWDEPMPVFPVDEE